MYCQNCGFELAQDANFCSSCGTKIENTATATTAAAPVASSSTAPATTAAAPATTATAPATTATASATAPTTAAAPAAADSAGFQKDAEQQAQPAQASAEQPMVPLPNQQQYSGSGQQSYQQSYQPSYQQPSAQNYTETVYAHTQQTETLALVAFVFALISTIAVGWLLIPLAWMIPMTVRTWGIYKGKKPNTTAFGVCTLLFLNLVGGILLLVADKDQ